METVFWRQFTALCEQSNISPNAVMLKTGLNTGNPPAWKKGRVPGTKAAQTIADYFGVSVDFLLSGEQKEKSSEAEASELSEDALMAARIIDRLPPEGRRLILAQMQAAERELLTQDGGQESPESQ